MYIIADVKKWMVGIFAHHPFFVGFTGRLLALNLCPFYD